LLPAQGEMPGENQDQKTSNDRKPGIAGFPGQTRAAAIIRDSLQNSCDAYICAFAPWRETGKTKRAAICVTARGGNRMLSVYSKSIS
jgi:hypothetical protein